MAAHRGKGRGRDAPEHPLMPQPRPCADGVHRYDPPNLACPCGRFKFRPSSDGKGVTATSPQWRVLSTSYFTVNPSDGGDILFYDTIELGTPDASA